MTQTHCGSDQHFCTSSMHAHRLLLLIHAHTLVTAGLDWALLMNLEYIYQILTQSLSSLKKVDLLARACAM